MCVCRIRHAGVNANFEEIFDINIEEDSYHDGSLMVSKSLSYFSLLLSLTVFIWLIVGSRSISQGSVWQEECAFRQRKSVVEIVVT